MIRQRAFTRTIRTPEGIRFDLPLAGPVSRGLALSVDLICVMAVSAMVGKVAAVVGSFSPDVAAAVQTVSFFVVSVGYGMAMEWLWRGRTVGKRLLGLRVVDLNGLNLTFGQVALRNLLRFVDGLPVAYLVGGLACLTSSQAQRLGDLAANTIVVRRPRTPPPDLDQILTEAFNSFRRYPHLEARLRQRTPPPEAGLALDAIIRRDQLEPGPRLALFAEMAAHFRGKVAFPQQATEGLSDERYVRNVVDSLFRRQGPGKDR